MPQMGSPTSRDDDNRSLSQWAGLAARGDVAAFRAVHDRLDPGVRRFFRRRFGTARHAADELAQRTWVAFWESLRRGSYDATRSSVTTYVYAVAYKVWLQSCRRPAARRIEPHDLAELSGVPFDSGGQPFDVMHAAELVEAMQDCLTRSAGLSGEEAAVIEASSRGMSEREIALSQGVAPSTVNARKRTALAKLRHCMESKGFRGEHGEHERPAGE